MPSRKRDHTTARAIARRGAEADIKNADHDLGVLRDRRSIAERDSDEDAIANIDQEIGRIQRKKTDAQRRLKQLED